MTADTDDADDGQLEELQERVETLEGASETLAETADTVQERAGDTLGEGGDSLFDGVDDAAGEVSDDTVADGCRSGQFVPLRSRFRGDRNRRPQYYRSVDCRITTVSAGCNG
jgi:hypothetical protein